MRFETIWSKIGTEIYEFEGLTSLVTLKLVYMADLDHVFGAFSSA